jgi:hypothetical protein
MSKFVGLVAASLIMSAASAHAAGTTFFGEDLHSSANTPLASTPNANAAEASFLSFLSGTSTEDFEAFSSGAGTPLNLSFSGSAGALSATLTGGNGAVQSVTPGSTNGFGRYATSGSNFFEVSAGGANNFVSTFGTAIASFGFNGIDIGDFGGQLQLDIGFDDTSSEIVNVPTTVGSGGSTDGSVFYFGYIIGSGSPLISTVSFLTTTGSGDIFAFDDFTIGDRQQTTTPTIPVPAALPLMASGLAAIGLVRRRRSAA